MAYKNKTADLVYDQMLRTTCKDVSQTALRIMDSIQSTSVANQMLGLASALIVMLHNYELSHTDVLGIADNMVYSGDNNNMKPDFKVIKTFMKNEWEI